MFTYGSLQTLTRLSPETSIQLHNPFNNSQSCNVHAIVDTGAVMTCIPESTITQLGSSLVYSEVALRDANNNIQRKRTYFINITIANHNYENLEVVAIRKAYALIGRDILNQHTVVLDAPIQRWVLT